MNSMQRVLTTLAQQEADKVPLGLFLTTTGAKFSQCSIKQYFSNPEQVASAQIQMQQRYRSDVFNSFYYAAAEVEAFGSETVFLAMVHRMLVRL
jgi:uroporphyrinogen decarboxylase